MAQQLQQEIGGEESADMLRGSDSEEVEGSIPIIDLNGDQPPTEGVINSSPPVGATNRQTHTPPEDSLDAQLLNEIALHKVLSSVRSSTAPSGNTTKRKRQESKAPQGSPEKRNKGRDAAVATVEGKVLAEKKSVSSGGKLARVRGLSRKPRELKQNHHGPTGDVFAVPDEPVVKAGRPKSSSKQSQQGRSGSATYQSAPEQANTRKTSNRRSKRTQASRTIKTKPKAVDGEDDNSVSTSRAKSTKESRSATSKWEQEPSDDRPELEVASHAPVRRSQRTKKAIEPTEPRSRGHDNDKRVPSLDGQNEEVGSAKGNVIDENEGEVGAEAHESSDDDPSYHASKDENHIEDDNENGNLEKNDKEDSSHGDDDKRGDDKPSLNENEQEFEEHNEDPVEDSEVELFGEKDSWAKVLEGARDVGVSTIDGERVKELPKVQTRIIGDLIKLISGVEIIYESLTSYQGLAHDNPDGLREELVKGLGEITESIVEISEPKSKLKSQRKIQDIYAYAIPNLSKLLRVALVCRTCDYSQEHDFNALEEVIGLQMSILDLCEKARRWKAKPLTRRPIVNSTRNNIHPYLRHVNKAFQSQLDERVRHRALKEQDECLQKLREKRDERDRQQKERQRKVREESRRRIAEDLASQRPVADRSRRLRSKNEKANMSSSAHRHPRPGNWTDEQVHELLVQLQRKDYRDLPGMIFQWRLRQSD